MRISRTKPEFLVAVASAALLSLVPAPLAAQATTVTSSSSVPVSETFVVPCANGGAGETVLIEGSLHLLFHVTIDAEGGTHVVTHANPQGLAGTGQTTGDTFRSTGVRVSTTNQPGPPPAELTAIDTLRFVTRGPGNNFTLRTFTHLTVNANGEVTAVRLRFEVECQ